MAKVTVTTAGKLSGTTATAILRETSSNCSKNAHPVRKTPPTTTTATKARELLTKTLPSWVILCCKGVGSVSTDCSISAICPISVCMAVFETITFPRPCTTSVPWKTRFRRSPRGASRGKIVSAFFVTAAASPVNADSRTCKFCASRSLPSAGICTPASKSIISPGTNSLAEISAVWPWRIILTLGEERFFRAARAFSARLSCK